MLYTLTIPVYKNVTAQPIFLSKNITSLFQDSTWQVKIKMRTTISNGFYVIRLDNFIKKRLITKSRELLSDERKGHASNP